MIFQTLLYKGCGSKRQCVGRLEIYWMSTRALRAPRATISSQIITDYSITVAVAQAVSRSFIASHLYFCSGISFGPPSKAPGLCSVRSRQLEMGVSAKLERNTNLHDKQKVAVL